MKVVYSQDINFTTGDEYDNSDFAQWVNDGSVPGGLMIKILGTRCITMSSGHLYVISSGERIDIIELCMRYAHTGRLMDSTHTRSAVLQYIKKFSDERRAPPTNKEMSSALYITRPGISWHTKQLINHCMIDSHFGITEIGEEVLRRINAGS